MGHSTYNDTAERCQAKKNQGAVGHNDPGCFPEPEAFCFDFLHPFFGKKEAKDVHGNGGRSEHHHHTLETDLFGGEFCHKGSGHNDNHTCGAKGTKGSEGGQSGSLLGILGHHRSHGPVGDVDEGVGHTVENISDVRIDKFLSMRKLRHTEHKNGKTCDRKRPPDKVRSELSPAGMGMVGDESHDGIIDGIPGPGHKEENPCCGSRYTENISIKEEEEVGDHGKHHVVCRVSETVADFVRQSHSFHSYPSINIILSPSISLSGASLKQLGDKTADCNPGLK